MKVTRIASTGIDWRGFTNSIRGTVFADQALSEIDVTSPDHLAEFAGRACYKSWDRPNPDTATTDGYLANILRQGHHSVLEHSSVTFYVQGVSRALLLELERHRFLSFSVESQRYVDQAASHPEPVIPPALASRPAVAGQLRDHYRQSMSLYTAMVDRLGRLGKTKKEAREAARAFLPNATPVDFVVTGNLRAWRDVLGKRHHVAADAEMREFAAEILRHLREVAPFSVQDIPSAPYGTATAGERSTTEKVVDVAFFADWLHAHYEPGDTIKSSDITGWIEAHWNQGE